MKLLGNLKESQTRLVILEVGDIKENESVREAWPEEKSL